MTAEASYENPLIPNARLKQIYLAMVRARLLGRALPAKRRGDWAAGMEACVVSTSVGLGPQDFVSDAVAGGVMDFLRGGRLASVLSVEASGRGGVSADCGAALRLPAVAGGAERLWTVVGVASALKAAAKSGVVVAYVRPGEVSAVVWRRVLGFAAQEKLPILFAVMPPARGDARRPGAACAVAHDCGVPGIAVDGDDAVAIYRVAQESIGRGRIGDGAVVMECVPFVVSGTKNKPANDGVAGMERYMLRRGVVTQVWMEREAREFARRLGTRITPR